MVKVKKQTIPVLHPARIELAKRLRDSGELPVTVIDPAEKCHSCGPTLACKRHRCHRDHCLNIAEADTPWCALHRSGRLIMTPEKIAEMLKLRAEGLTQPAIARLLGVSIPTVHNYLRKAKAS